jgi:threonine dehydrogenase-like Zn-dependent dehydrogenase
MGEVVDTGRDVNRLAIGDRVVVPFVIACGRCHFCERQLYAACETTNPDSGTILNKKSLRPGAAMFGYTHHYGGVPGGQAEYARVPRANVGPIRIPEALSDEQVLFLSDILPTGYQAVLNAQVEAGSSVAIYGAGPVGQMAAACARMLGADPVFMVDRVPYRLEYARAAYGAVPIDFDQVDAAEVIIAHTASRGVDAVIDAVGFEAEGSTLETALTSLKLEGSSGAALRQCIAAVKRGGTVSVPGVYAGFIHGFLFGDAFEKGITIRAGQTHVQRHMPALLERIWEGRLQPQALISHRLPLEQAAEGYRLFDRKEDQCRKVILRPAA